MRILFCCTDANILTERQMVLNLTVYCKKE